MDPEDEIAEQNENDNSASKSIFVLSGLFEWWNTSWNYRVLVTFTNGDENISDALLTTEINFTQGFNHTGDLGKSLDVNSIRVIEYNASSGEIVNEEIPYEFQPAYGFNETSNAVGKLSWFVNGTTQANEIRHYYVYFDSLDNPKPVFFPSFKESLYWGKEFLAPASGNRSLFIIAREETQVNLTNSSGDLTSVTVGSGTSPGVYNYPFSDGFGLNPEPVEIRANKEVLVYITNGSDDKEYVPPANPEYTLFYGICTEDVVVYNAGNGTAHVVAQDIAWSGDTDTDDSFTVDLGPGGMYGDYCDGRDFIKITSNESLRVLMGSSESGIGESISTMIKPGNSFWDVKKGKHFSGPIATPAGTPGGILVIGLYDSTNVSINCTNGNYNYVMNRGQRISIEDNSDFCEIQTNRTVYVISYDEDYDEDFTEWLEGED